MVEYKENRTDAYVCTVSNDKEGLRYLATIRKTIARVNRHNRRFFPALKNTLRVTVKARKPIRKKFSVCKWTGKMLSYSGYNQNGDVVGGLRNAAELDIYVHTRYNY